MNLKSCSQLSSQPIVPAGGLMAKHRDAKKEALLNRLARIQDDIERLSQLDQTPDISDAIEALISEATELEANIAKLQEATSTRDNAKKARALCYRGLSLDEIAAALAISKSSAHRYCGDIPVDKRRYALPRLTQPVWLDAAKSMLHEGKTRHVIAKELGIPLSRFYRAFERFARM